MFLKRAMVTLVLAGVASAVAFAQMTDPMSGTWKLNAAKSKSPYKSGTSVSEGTARAAGTSVKVPAMVWFMAVPGRLVRSCNDNVSDARQRFNVSS